MSNVTVESLGVQNFYEVRDSLLEQGKKFDEKSLALVQYDQLVNCALGIADSTVCSLQKVREEKRRRRARFLSLDAKSLENCLDYLHIHQMEEDIRYHLAMRDAPRWEDLSYRVRSWAKLTCLINHVDFPLPRLTEVQELIGLTTLPETVSNNYIQRIKIMASSPENLVAFRFQLNKLADDLTLSFAESDSKMIEKHLISDFSCTSDCFRVI
jgi:hypothetical protein